jgi:hypothetical protein
MTKTWSYRSPEQILKELWIETPEDIDIEAIATYCSATIVYEALSGCEARLLGKANKAIITVNSRSPRERQRFSAGHELGHWMRDRGRMAFSCDDSAFNSEWDAEKENPERNANCYSADLLLPKSMFANHAQKRPITFETVRDLSASFQTSLTATAIRLVELGSYPAMIVCNEKNGRRRWFVRSSDIPRSLWPRNKPASYTIASEILRGVAQPQGPVEVSSAGWFDCPGSDRYAIQEDSLQITTELVLSLLWWKDERQLIEMEENDL